MSQKVCAVIVSARPQSVHACLVSLLAQSLSTRDFRLLVVAEYDQPVLEHEQIHWILKAPRSIAAKRNIGLRNAGTPVVAFTDDDCLAEPDWLAKGLRHLEGHPDEIGVQGRIHVPSAQVDHPNYGETARLVRPLYQTSNIFYRTQELLAAGGFDERFAFQREDVEMGFRLTALGHRIGYCEEAVVVHPVRKGELWDLIKTAFRKRYDPLLLRLYRREFRTHFGSILPGSFRLMLLLWIGYLFSNLLFCPVCSLAIPLSGALVLATRRLGMRWPGITWLGATVISYLVAPLVAAAVIMVGFIRFRRAA